jgi:anaerobic selenocysteine-containing dehydrogenase
VQPVIAPAGEAKSNQEVFRELGRRLGLTDDTHELGEAGALLEAAARLPETVSAALLEGRLAPAVADGAPVQFVDVHPNTPDGKVHLFPTDLASQRGLYDYAPDPATSRFPLSLISPASEHTISSTLGELRPGVARMKIHPDDARARSIAEGDPVRIFNALGEVHCETVVTPEVRPGTVSLPKGLWTKSTFNGSTATALAPDTLTDIGDGACFNDARVQVELLGRH